MVFPANASPPICDAHKIPARLWPTHKNPNKKFYRCGTPIGQQCTLFEWVESEETPPSSQVALPPTPKTDGPSSEGPKVAYSTMSTNSKRNISTLGQHDEGRDESEKRAKVTSNACQNPGSTFLQNVNRDQEMSDAHGSRWPPHTPPKTPDQPFSFNERMTRSGGDSRNMSRHYGSPKYDFKVFDSPVSSSSQETLRGEIYQEPNAEAITEMIHQLQNLHDYIQKLERKKIPAEKSRDAKNSKMDSLQEQVKSLEREVQRLKNREVELEEVIAAYEKPA